MPDDAKTKGSRDTALVTAKATKNFRKWKETTHKHKLKKLRKNKDKIV